jgi:hypothetical protein
MAWGGGGNKGWKFERIMQSKYRNLLILLQRDNSDIIYGVQIKTNNNNNNSQKLS